MLNIPQKLVRWVCLSARATTSLMSGNRAPSSPLARTYNISKPPHELLGSSDPLLPYLSLQAPSHPGCFFRTRKPSSHLFLFSLPPKGSHSIFQFPQMISSSIDEWFHCVLAYSEICDVLPHTLHKCVTETEIVWLCSRG